MTDEANDQESPEEKPENVDGEDAGKRRARIFQHQVATLMDELKSLFSPDMRLTFIARSIDDSTKYSLLTEETENVHLIRLLQEAKQSPISRPDNSSAIN